MRAATKATSPRGIARGHSSCKRRRSRIAIFNSPRDGDVAPRGLFRAQCQAIFGYNGMAIISRPPFSLSLSLSLSLFLARSLALRLPFRLFSSSIGSVASTSVRPRELNTVRAFSRRNSRARGRRLLGIAPISPSGQTDGAN